MTNKERQDFERSGKLRWFHWVVVILSLFLTLGAWYISKKQVDERVKARFDREANQVAELILERLKKYGDVLQGGAAFIKSQNGEVDYLEWKRYALELKVEKKYPGVSGIGVIHYVAPKKLGKYLAQERRYRPYFNIHPKHDKNEYWPISYIEPQEGNAKAVGLDMAHEQNRFEAAKKARDENKLQITGPIILVQDAKKTPGFLFYAPFYKKQSDTIEERRENFVGMVYAPFVMNMLMQGALEKEKRHVGVSIRDGNSVLYNENILSEEDFDPNPLFKKQITLNIYGRDWAFDVWSAKSFRSSIDKTPPTLILIGGILVDCVLFALFMFLARLNRRAIVFADKMVDLYRVNSQKLTKIDKISQAIIQNAADGLITINKIGTIESFNPTCERLFGYSKEEVLGKNIKMLMPSLHQEKHDGYLGNYAKTGKKKVIGANTEVEGLKKDGSRFPIELSISEIVVNDQHYFSGIIRDITQRKKIDGMKDEFISTVNHEIRTPLTSIQGSIALLKAREGKKLDAQSAKLLNISHDNCELLACLVNDILDVEKIAAGKMKYNMQIADIGNIVKDCVDKNDGYAKKYGIEFKVKQKVKKIDCLIDINRFGQALTNLLSNAAKFSPKGATVDVLIESHGTKSNKVKISVIDVGPGIPESFHGNIFKRFSQVDSSATRKKGGSGLGLNIAKSMIKAFKGDIGFDSKEEKGSTFYIILPINKN